MTWIAAELQLSDGRTIRFGGDEADAENVPSQITFETSNPGGFASGSLTLPRPENLVADDAKLFSSIRMYGEGNTTFYSGLIVGVPQVGSHEIQLNLAGWVTVLDKVETFREIFVDRDLSNWGETSTARKLALLSGGTWRSVNGPEAGEDASDPAVILTLPAGDEFVIAEAMYRGAANIGSIYYSLASQSTAAMASLIGIGDNDAGTGFTFTADLIGADNGSASGTLSAVGRFAVLIFSKGAITTTPDSYARFTDIAVFGDHGLTKRGVAPDQGFFASDVVAHAITKAPSLNWSTDSIETTSFVIPHLTFPDDTTLRSVVEQVTALGGNQNVPCDWGVYEDREFYWRSPGTYGRTWHVRRDEVAESSSDGPDADRRVAGVKVNYTDGAGTSRSVGPPGSNADYETTDLLDSDPNNPALRIPGAYKSESIGITSQQGAINCGVMILNERNRLDWRGSINIHGTARDANGNEYPAALVRAGDRIVVSDDDGAERTITSTSYDHDSLTCSASIGAPPDSLESLLAQLAAVTDLVRS